MGAGHIGAALRGARTGDTLCHAGGPAPVTLPRLTLPAPVFTAALETSGPREAAALGEALEVLCREDPTLHARTHAGTGQLLLSDMGELHLDVAADRLRREHGIAGLTLGRVQARRPARRRTVRRPLTGRSRPAAAPPARPWR